MCDLTCVSCKVVMKRAYLYCYQCNKDMDKLNDCKGFKVNGDPCTLKTTGHACKYHCVKIVPGNCPQFMDDE